MDEKKFLDLDGLAYFKQKLDDEISKNYLPILELTLEEIPFDTSLQDFCETIKLKLNLNDLNNLILVLKYYTYKGIMSFQKASSSTGLETYYIYFIDTTTFYTYYSLSRGALNSTIRDLFSLKNRNFNYVSVQRGQTSENVTLSYVINSLMYREHGLRIINISGKLNLIYCYQAYESASATFVMKEIDQGYNFWYRGTVSASQLNTMTIKQFKQLYRENINQSKYSRKTIEGSLSKNQDLTFGWEEEFQYSEKIDITMKLNLVDYSGTINDISVYLYNDDTLVKKIILINSSTISNYNNDDFINISLESYETQILYKASHINGQGASNPPFNVNCNIINYGITDGSFDKLSIVAQGEELEDLNWEIYISHQLTEVE